MPRINQLPAASSVASTDVVAIDTQDKTYRVPKSTLFDGYYTAAEVDAAIAQSTADAIANSTAIMKGNLVDFNSFTSAGYGVAYSPSNSPYTGWVGGLCLPGPNANYCMQLAYSFYSAKVSFRTCNNATWSSWKEIA